RDVETAMAIGIPPLQLDNVLEAEIGNQIEHMMRDYECWRGSALLARQTSNRAQGVPVQVVEMSVRNQDHVDGRQVAHVESGLANTPEEKQPSCEVWADENALSAYLQEETRVADKGDSQLAVVHEPGLVSSSRAGRHRGVSHKARKLARPFA